jgi:hypothetical protein
MRNAVKIKEGSGHVDSNPYCSRSWLRIVTHYYIADLAKSITSHQLGLWTDLLRVLGAHHKSLSYAEAEHRRDRRRSPHRTESAIKYGQSCARRMASRVMSESCRQTRHPGPLFRNTMASRRVFSLFGALFSTSSASSSNLSTKPLKETTVVKDFVNVGIPPLRSSFPERPVHSLKAEKCSKPSRRTGS